MAKRPLAVLGFALSTGLIATAVAPLPAYSASTTSTPVFLAARMIGENEVPTGGAWKVNVKPAGDEDGSALAVFRIHGDTVAYAIRWDKVARPTGFHIHKGNAGVNGDVVIPFFGKALPTSALAVMGEVKVKDRALLRRIVNNPQGWYANLHNKDFPGGAVRAQLQRIRPTHLPRVLATPAKESLWTVGTGGQEVPTKGAKVGDKDGRAEWLFLLDGKKMLYAAAWEKIAPPIGGHIHRGVKGKNGPVRVPFFADGNGLPASITGIAGEVPIKADLAQRIRKNPQNWYANLHTGQFPGGAVRGQLRAYNGGW